MRNSYNKLNCLSLHPSLLPTASYPSISVLCPKCSRPQGPVGIKVKTDSCSRAVLHTFLAVSLLFQPFTIHCTGDHPKWIPLWSQHYDLPTIPACRSFLTPSLQAKIYSAAQSPLDSQRCSPTVFLSLASFLFQGIPILLKPPTQPWCLLLSYFAS